MENTRSEIINLMEKYSDALFNINKEIWSNPEVGFQEHHAHAVITDFLQKHSFDVEREFIHKTGFRATFNVNNNKNLLNVAFLCEYDAAEELGHGTGHNLLTEASLACALALKHCIEKKLISLTITILGTPAELCGGGTKIDMLKAGVFKNINMAFMMFPFNMNIASPKALSLLAANVTYKGKSTHSSVNPWEGKNALDAAVACYNNVALLRQQLRPNWLINGIITKGGILPSIIPAFSELKFWLRAPTHTDMLQLQQKCAACFVAAGKATGCETNFEYNENIYYPMTQNEEIAKLYESCAVQMGITFSDNAPSHINSTDMGNVSQIVPSLFPAFDIGTSSLEMTETFVSDCASKTAHENVLKAAAALAFTVALISKDEVVIEKLKSERS